jgi:hypothetical protein
MTEGQRAMAVAVIYPETKQGKKQTSSERKMFLVLGCQWPAQSFRYAPQQVNAVLSGGKSLDEAYKVAHDANLYEGEEVRFAELRKGGSNLVTSWLRSGCRPLR